MKKESGIQIYEKRMKWLRKVDLTSDIFAAAVFEDVMAVQDVLRILTGMMDLHVKKVIPQKTIRNIYGHSNVLDVWGEDEKFRQYSMELQMSERNDHIRRNRYIQSQIDTRVFSAGEEYNDIPDLFLIFITKRDFLHQRTGITEVIRYIQGDNQEADNGVHEIYVNLQYKAEREEVNRLLDYFKDTNNPPENCRGFENLVKRVEYLKKSEEGVHFMCEWSQWERECGREEGRAEGREELICNMLRKKQTPEFISEVTDLPLSYVYEVGHELNYC